MLGASSDRELGGTVSVASSKLSIEGSGSSPTECKNKREREAK